MFSLSKQLFGHEQDVRAVATSGGRVYSASRDGTVRQWNTTSNTEVNQYRNHTGFVNSLTANDSQIISGAQDCIIQVLDINTGALVQSLKGHEANVCALSIGPHGEIISGSWDGTARLWIDGKCAETMEGHTGAVWAVLWTDQGILTGGADRTIRLWKGGRQIKNIPAGKDCVRALASHPLGFASAGNDSIIRVHTSDGDVVQELTGHESFVYSLAVDSQGTIYSTGEDRTLRIWQDGVLQQTITHPAISVWSVALLENGDVVTGASDGTVRLFTASSKRKAAAEAIKEFEDQVAASIIPAQAQNIPNNLPGLEALSGPGAKEGEVKMIRVSPEMVEAHQWSGGVWSKIGEVMGASPQKVTYENKEWDFVFDVDIAEGQPPLKLPYNTDENPYEAANRFIEKYELDVGFQAQIVKFIETNTAGIKLGGVPKPSEPAPAPGILPQKTYLSMTVGNIAPIIAKLNVFAAELTQFQVDTSSLTSLDIQRPSSAQLDTLVKIIGTWPKDKLFPALDLLRLCIPKAPAETSWVNLIDVTTKTVALDGKGPSKSDETNIMLSLRCLANLYTNSTGLTSCQNIEEPIETVANISVPTNRNLSIARSTYLLNVSVSAYSSQSTLLAINVITPLTDLLKTNTDAEIQYRSLVALGTALHVSTDVVEAAKDVFEIPALLKGLKVAQEKRTLDVMKELHAFLV